MTSLARLKRFFLPVLLFLGIFAGAFAVSNVVPNGAFAQTTTPAPATPGGSTTVGGVLWDLISNGIVANPRNTKTVYNVNYKLLQGAGCWGCEVFDSFAKQTFSAGDAISSGALMGKLASVIVAVASLFSLVYLGSAFVSGDAGDLLSRWKVFWQLLIAVAISTAWLTTGSQGFGNTWNVIYGPLLNIPLGIADAVPGGVDGPACAGGNVAATAGIPAGAIKAVEKMREVVCGGHNISIKGIAFGLTLAGSGDGFVGTVMNILAGFAVMIVFFWVAISFPLRFIDVLLRLTVVGIVTPVIIVCAAFKPTRSYIQIAISNVLYAGCLFAFTSIMFKLGGNFFDTAAMNRIESMGSWDPSVVISQSVMLVGAAVIFASMLRMAPSLASEFSQFRGQSGGVGDAATGFASSIATLPVKAGTAVVAAKTGGAIAAKAGAAGGASMAKSLGKGVTEK